MNASTARRQEERSAATQRALLDAVVVCLTEKGFSGTTSEAVAQQAGFSRGAQLHHFGGRDQMVVAAVEHLAEKRLAFVREALAQYFPDSSPRRDGAHGPDGTSAHTRERRLAALLLLAEGLSGPLYSASLELWIAARTRPDLRSRLLAADQRVTATMAEICRDYVTEDPVRIRLTLDLLLGRGVSGLLVPGNERDQERALATWARMLNDSDTAGGDAKLAARQAGNEA